MSFQGDVGGIGLAELLQSLSRGRREGILKLHTRSGLTSTLGLSQGTVTFLPDEDEDPRTWQARARQAWIHDLDERMTAMRMSEIARAHRIERVYDILDSEGVHFRFTTGDIPSKPTGPVQDGKQEAGAARLGEVHCSGLAVELLLLEYARMSDEAAGAEARLGFTNFVVPRVLDSGTKSESDRFLQHCDGCSTLSEIADRLGWPIRQARLVFADHQRAGTLRAAEYRELLVLAQKELSQGHVSRAAARLVAWIQSSPAGPLGEGDAQLLTAEFRADRMGPLLNLMPVRETRTLLRRLDHALGDPEAAVKHWRELGRLKRSDSIIEVHRLGAEFRWEEDEELPSLRDLLDAGRRLREDGHPGRAAAFLRMAASRDPASAGARLDIGLGMLAADLIEEGAAWILDACQTLIASGHAEKAVPALRTLLETDGSIREARRMLGRLKHLTVRKQLIRKNSLVALSIVGLLAAGGWVHLSSQRNRELKITEIAQLVDEPSRAQALLESYFPEDDSERIEQLREVIGDRRKFQDNEARSAWYELYREAQLACSLGAPVDGLSLAVELPPPPRLATLEEPWPLASDLFNGLAARLAADRAALGELDLDGLDQIEAEKHLASVVEALLERCAELDSGIETGDLIPGLEVMAKDMRKRIQDRTERLTERARLELVTRQDLMLAAARAHAQAGDLARAIEQFDELIATDESGRLREILEEEDLSDLRRRYGALQRARGLAEEGQHAAALEVLGEEFKSASEHPLPWKLEVFPAGALVHLSDGTSVSPPFVVESRAGEVLEFFVEYEGHRSETLRIDSPADRYLWLSRTPERAWVADGRVDALPVSVGEEHVVCDRTGKVARLGSKGETLWEIELRSLGGIGRAPVSLPAKPEELLLLTEDGEAWLVDSRDGERTGPWPLGSGPIEGPAPAADGVLARLRDGRLMRWTQRVKPRELRDGSEDAIVEEERQGALGGLAVLRRAEGARRVLDSPWTDWRVELLDEVYRVHRADAPTDGYAVRRSGDWSYVAWEAPRPGLEQGRLWVSDGAGLRAFVE